MQLSRHTLTAACGLAASALVADAAHAQEVFAAGNVVLNQAIVTGDLGPSVVSPQGSLNVARTGGSGRVSVLDGGLLDIGVVSLGFEGPALVEIDGFGSRLNANEVQLGNASLRVTDGGSALVNRFGPFNGRSQELLTVDGFGSSLVAFSSLNLASGPGEIANLQVTGGGQLSVTGLNLALSFSGAPSGTNTAQAAVSGVGSRLSITDAQRALAIGPGATLNVADGGTVVGAVDVFGRLQLDGGQLLTDPQASSAEPLRLFSGGRVVGGGSVGTTLDASQNSRLDVGPGQTLAVGGGLAGTSFLAGLATVEGGTLAFDGAAALGVDGDLVATGASLEAATWFIDGSLAAIGGATTEVDGDVEIQSTTGAKISASGGSDLLFFDGVTNNGTLDVRDGSAATFLGRYSGAGNLGGGGDYVFLGEFAIGNSPAIVAATGNFTFGTDGTTTVEIDGRLPGEFDVLNVVGSVTLLDRPLVVDFLDELDDTTFTPTFGDSFTFLTATGGINGTFDFDPLLLSNGLTLELRYTATSATLVAVPEPAAATAAMGLLGLVSLRRRRGRTA